MKIYILTSAAVLTEGGQPDLPSVTTKVFLSVLEAQLAMKEQLDAEIRDAESSGQTVYSQNLDPVSASLSVGNDARTDIVWDIEEFDVAVSSRGNADTYRSKLAELVNSYGKLNDKGQKSLVLNAGKKEDPNIYIGGWNNCNYEVIDEIRIAGNDEIFVETKGHIFTMYDIPSDDLEYIISRINANLDYYKALQEYFQPELIISSDVPEGLASFEVFPTEEDLKTWMDRHGYLEGEYTISKYRGWDWDIEGPTFLNGMGETLFDEDFEEDEDDE